MALIREVVIKIIDIILNEKFTFSGFLFILKINIDISTNSRTSKTKRYCCGCGHLNGVIISLIGPKRKVRI